MQELNYIKQDTKMPGREFFVTYVDFQVQDGTADMRLYDIFPGVQLMVVDFASESCFGISAASTGCSLRNAAIRATNSRNHA